MVGIITSTWSEKGDSKITMSSQKISCRNLLIYKSCVSTKLFSYKLKTLSLPSFVLTSLRPFWVISSSGQRISHTNETIAFDFWPCSCHSERLQLRSLFGAVLSAGSAPEVPVDVGVTPASVGSRSQRQARQKL